MEGDDERREDSALGLVHDDFLRRFDLELAWKDTLESKAVTFLGFVGIFVAVLLSVATLGQVERMEVLGLLTTPLVVQTLAALLLFYVIFGYSVSVGPALTDMTHFVDRPVAWVQIGTVIAYGSSMLRNRAMLSVRVVLFQVSVLLVAASLVQIAISLSLSSIDTQAYPWIWAYGAPLWVPALAVSGGGAVWLYRDFLGLKEKQGQELSEWLEIIENWERRFA